METRLITGGFGSGKTQALVDRWVALAAEHGAARVLFVTRGQAAAGDVRRRLVAASVDAGVVAGPLVVTTWPGVALDVLRRLQPELGDATVGAGADQRHLVAELFAADAPSAWSANGAMAKRRAFPVALASAVRAVLASGLSDEAIQSVAEHHGVGERWQELLAFVGRYRAALRQRNSVDGSELVSLAAAARDDAGASIAERFVEVLVDDAEALSPGAAVLLESIAAAGCSVTVAENRHGWRGRTLHEPIDFVSQFVLRHQTPVTQLDEPSAARARLVFCRHPSIEADAVVGELVAAHDRGTAWHDMAVVVPRLGTPIGRAVNRALRRRSIPVRVSLVDGDAEPVVQRVVELLRQGDPAAPLRESVDDVIQSVLAELTAGNAGDLVDPEPSLDRAIDALVACNAIAHRWIEAQPAGTAEAFIDALTDSDGPLVFDTYGGETGGVEIISADQAGGRRFGFAVVPSCVEGEYPRVDVTIDWFDAAITTPIGPLELAERRRVAVAEQRARFGLAASRSSEVVFVTAPQPGVLVSRYVQEFAAEDPDPAWPESAGYERKPATVSLTPMHPSGSLRLSASQLSTFEDCPRRWYYASVLRLDDSTSVWTEFGSLVHNVLEAFLDPATTVEYSLEALLELSEDMWTDTIAQFAPQREQARRELREMLQKWWDIEGSRQIREQVLAVEHEFAVEVGPHIVRGRIDRVDFDPDRNGVSVVDYKTGRRLPKREDVEHDLQLAVYYLAALRSEELAAVGPPTRLELLYFRAREPYFEQKITENHEQAAEERILAAAQEMLDEQLEPTVEADCDHCDFHRLCSLQKSGREVGAS